ncbi:hypothetical protein [Methylobacterium sp. Leaf469]|uniref:hypothetical protein n=1 Tax=Methylobacterium sp. Leaf469 TaxID=1736387 RepID=UPI000A60B027|nr:hypothetical protein [Methylobacterium sp. Leaf469]
MAQMIGLKPQVLTTPATQADVDAERRYAAVRNLVMTLSRTELERLLREIQDTLGPAPKGGDVLTTIVNFLGKKKSWSISEIKKQVDDEGIVASPKEVYNAVGYLNKRGHIQRVAYGQYLVDGQAFITAEDIGPDNRYEESYKIQD